MAYEPPKVPKWLICQNVCKWTPADTGTWKQKKPTAPPPSKARVNVQSAALSVYLNIYFAIILFNYYIIITKFI